jgi:probable rRNA maturation factor
MVRLLQLDKNDVSFVLTDDKTIHQLNKIYRRMDRPTDVLAFAMREGDFAELAGAALGDVVVSVEAARKQARDRGVTALDEITMLLAHGLLHLLGWDHETPAKDRRMRAETDRLCLAARPLDRSVAGKSLSARASAPPSTLSKPGADQALSLKRSALKRRGRRRKVGAPPLAKAGRPGKR